MVFPFSRALFGKAAAEAAALRASGLAVDLVLEEKKPKWLFKQAERVGAAYVVLLGDSEAEKGVVQVKNLAKGTQSEVRMGEVADFITQDSQSAQE